MARYSVQERIGRAMVAFMILVVVLALGYAFAPRAVFGTSIGQLTIGQAVLAGIWANILIECISGVGVLLFEAITGRERVREDQPRADREQRPAPAPEGLRKQPPLPVWLKPGRPWQT